jgi:hypothetical protein
VAVVGSKANKSLETGWVIREEEYMPTIDDFIRPKEWVSDFLSSFESEYLGE